MLEKGTEDTSKPILSASIDHKTLQMDGDESTLRPFGKAYFYREASYFLLPVSVLLLYNWTVRILAAVLNTVPILGAFHLTAGYLYGWSMADRDYHQDVGTSVVFTYLLFCVIVTNALHSFILFGIEIGGKWLIMGQRHEGQYNLDTSPYGQQWELYQLLAKFRMRGRTNILDLITGTPMMSMFFRALGCEIGKDCCLYPSGADPFMPEPDLVKMGDKCVVDCASVVCHLNTRGNFELKHIKMEANVTLRSKSRIQQGVHIEHGSMMLEKSLALTGEVIESDTIWLGAPAVRFRAYDTSSINSESYAGSHTSAFV